MVSVIEVLQKFGEVKAYPKKNRYYIEVSKDVLRDAIKSLIKAFDGDVYVCAIAAVDLIAQGLFELNYDIQVLKTREYVTIKVKIPRDKPVIPSISDMFEGVIPYENEVYDFYGIVFEGNKSPRKPYFLPDEMANEFPLRKDWKPPSRR